MITRCNYCEVDIIDNSNTCPLCRASLHKDKENDYGFIYPILFKKTPKTLLLRKILITLTILIIVFSILVNLFFSREFLWSLIIITVLAYFWLAFSNLLRKNRNPAFKILFQVLIASIIVTMIDYESGWYAWSVTYVVPVFFILAAIGILTLIIVNRTNWARYVYYQTILALLGLVPFALHLSHLTNNGILSVVASAVSFVSLVITFVFSDNSVKNEFKRRLHF